MKKRILIVIMAAALGAGSLTGCGEAAQVNAAAVASTATDESVPASEAEDAAGEHDGNGEEQESGEPEVSQESQETDFVEESLEKREVEEAEDNQESSKQSASAEPQGAEETEPGTDATEGSQDSGQTEIQAEAVEYTYTEITATMYAKSSVNVRDTPSTQGNKVSMLDTNQEVTVTGQCKETGWYRILLDDRECYVSDSYLVDAPVAVNAGIHANEDTGEVNTVEGGTASVVATSESSGTSQDFINLLNQKRAEAELGTLEWDSGLAEIA